MRVEIFSKFLPKRLTEFMDMTQTTKNNFFQYNKINVKLIQLRILIIRFSKFQTLLQMIIMESCKRLIKLTYLERKKKYKTRISTIIRLVIKWYS